MTRRQKLRASIWYHLSLYLPTAYLRHEAWLRWLEAQWLKPAPEVKPRRRRYRPEEETGIEDPRLAKPAA